MHDKDCPHYKEIHNEIKNTGRAKEYFLKELAYTVGPDRLKHMIETHLEDFTLVDVRKYEHYIKGHIPYAIHVPFDQLEEQMVQFSKDKINIIYSHSILCHLSKKAAYILADKGYPVMELTGGFKGWKKRDFDIVENDVSDYPG